MKTLILPVSGKSSRFKNTRPKWLLTMPDGKLMFEKSVEQLSLNFFSRIIIVCVKEHLNKYIDKYSLLGILKSLNHKNVELCVLDSYTKSQSETIAKALIKSNVKGSFFVKDCDNMFKFSWNGKNQIAVVDLNNIGETKASEKSYVITDKLNNVLNIVEKKVVSNTFCCGGYGFESADLFLKYFKPIRSNSEIYISHVIYNMLLDKILFSARYAEEYQDWGTKKEYFDYIRSFTTIFCDIDGVLFYNGSKFSKQKWKTDPILENLEKIKALQDLGKIFLVVTTSRPESEKKYLKNTLLKHGVKVNKFVMGLPHSKRIIINDFSSTNPYPSAISINIERESKSLSKILEYISET